MNRNAANVCWGFGVNEIYASPQPLSKGEGFCELQAFEARPPYESANKEMWGALKFRARENRKTPTDAEDKMWQSVRAGKLGHKIRRQHPIGVYIADFVCIIKRVVIEIDGGYHSDPEQIQNDAQRTFVLGLKGFKVLRVTNAEVEDDLHAVTAKIKNLLDGLPDVPYEPDK